jgi:hypothetical protein
VKCKSQGKDVEMAVNNKEEDSEDFCLDFVQEFGLRSPQIIFYSHSQLDSHVPDYLWV